MPIARIHHGPIHQRGSTLIEVLVALLVLGIGLGGLAVSQTQALVGARAAYFAFQAALLSEEAAELARAYAPTGVPVEERQAWQQRVETRLPAGATIELSLPVSYEPGEVILSWADQRLVRRFHP